MAAEEVCQEARVVETGRPCCSESQVEPPHLKWEDAFHTNVLLELGVPRDRMAPDNCL